MGDAMKYTVTPCDFDYNTNKRIIEALIKEYPFLNVQLIGRTAVGRSIFSLSLGKNKSRGLYVGSVRGSDGLSSLILLLFTERLCHAVKNNLPIASVNARKALSLSGVTVIPCLNPDGREIFLHGIKGAGGMSSFVSSFFNEDRPRWDGNAAGVDINRNFIFHDPLKEAVHSPAPSLFRGEYPESEAETKAFTRLCRTKRFHRCLELYGGEGEIFYKSDEGEPAEGQMMAKILGCSSSLPVNCGKNDFHCGISDWFIRELHRPSFSVGTGGSAEMLYETYSRLEEALTVFALL